MFILMHVILKNVYPLRTISKKQCIKITNLHCLLKKIMQLVYVRHIPLQNKRYRYLRGKKKGWMLIPEQFLLP